jgi:hypothetical protein
MKRKATYLISTAVLVAALVSPAADAGHGRLGLAGRTALLAGAPRHLAEASWWSGTYSIADGGEVAIYISMSYPEPGSLAQHWVDFFAGLPHGKEISALKIYIAPIAEVTELCSSVEALGCYGGPTLVTVGDTTDGIAPASVAAHEYGHHVAASRSNAPWRAVDWGTKRWASKVGVCSRVQSGTAFPGNEGLNYTLNPGEAFAESYRVLGETNGTPRATTGRSSTPAFGRPQSRSPPSATTSSIRGSVRRRRRFEAGSSAGSTSGPRRSRPRSTGTSVSG